MAGLDVLLLGPPLLLHGGVELELDTRKATALLAYLALNHHNQSRNTLAALLWPEYADENARAALRRTLSALTHALAATHIEISRTTVTLRRDAGVFVDVDRFRDLLASWREHGHNATEVCSSCLQPLSEAVALYRDDFLAGFALRDSVNFDDWQLQQATALQHELGEALDRLAQTQEALGDLPGAMASARRWLNLDRVNEVAHRRLMLLHVWSGQRAAAVRQYRECVQELAKELGVPPLAETTHLYEAISENRVPQRTTALAQTRTTSASHVRSTDAEAQQQEQFRSGSYRVALPLPLVGRAQEWRELQEAYDRVGTDGRLIVLLGEAGIGKTRLAGEFVAGALASGAIVLTTRCYEGEQNLTYGPVAALLRAALGPDGTAEDLEGIPEPWLREAARLVPDLIVRESGPPQVADEPGAQARFLEGICQVLLLLCRGPVAGIILFDDLHWADGATLDLVAYLVRRLRGQPVCVLATWRREQQPGGRLDRLAAEAGRAGVCTLLPLARFGPAEIGELVAARRPFAAGSPQLVVERLYAETEGNPFFLVEYLDALAMGAYGLEGEQWPLTAGVRDLLSTRLKAVSETGWQLLTTAAVIGRSFDFDTLREASGRSEEEAIDALDELVALGDVREMYGGAGTASYDFSHEKLRTLVYEEAGLVRRRLLHRRVAEAMLARARGRSAGAQAGQIAQHFRLAGNEELAAVYYRQAGEYARTLFANAEALAHFRTALALGHPEAAELQSAIGDLSTLLGEYRAALISYEAAAAVSDGATLAHLEHKLGVVYGRRGEWELAESHLQAALEAHLSTGPVAEAARVYADLSLVALQRGAIAQAEELAGRSVALAEGGDRRVLAQASNMLGLLASRRGDRALALAQLERGLRLAEELADAEVRTAALNNLALVYGAEGETEQALELARTALVLSQARGDRHHEAAIQNNIADLLHQVGRSGEAILHVKQAVAILGEIGAEAGELQPEIWKLSGW